MLEGIGKPLIVSNEDYKHIMEHLHELTDDVLFEYHKRAVEKLLSLKGEVISKPAQLKDKKAYCGEYVEYQLGLQQNPVQIGDILGLELKVWSSATQLSITSFSAEKRLGEYFGTKPPHLLVNHKAREQRRKHQKRGRTDQFVLFNGEGISYDMPSRSGLFKYQIDEDGQMLLFVRKDHSSDWDLLASKDIIKGLIKFRFGLLLVTYSGGRESAQCIINRIFYIPITVPSLIEMIKQGKVNYEIRYRKVRKEGKWDGEKIHSTGWGFRIAAKWVSKNWLTEEYEIKSVLDFEERYEAAMSEAHSDWRPRRATGNSSLDRFLDGSRT